MSHLITPAPGGGGGGGGVTDHGALTGLADDDHAQYFRADGVRAVTGNVSLSGVAPMVQATGANQGITIRGNKNAADAGSGVLITSVVTRTAGSLLEIQNNGTSYLSVSATGVLLPSTTNATDLGSDAKQFRYVNALQLFINGQSALTRTAGVTTLAGSTPGGDFLRLQSRVAAASASTDVQVQSEYTRTAGFLFDVRNGAAVQASINWAGVAAVKGLALTVTTQTTVGAAGAAAALPVPDGYLPVTVNGVAKLLAFFNA